MKPKIKICGIKTKEEVLMINKYPVDYIGFIFAKSKRQVTKETVNNLRDNIRKDIKVVGVFVDENIEKIHQIAQQCRLDVIQLHGNEDDDFCKSIQFPVWKSIAIRDKESLIKINDYKSVDGILLDTYHNGKSGGTGKSFRWDMVENVSKDHYLILAGGLTPDNIVRAMNKVAPQILDVNSGVETMLMKDEAKVKRLFAALDLCERIVKEEK